jgi:hypothetical protein
MDRVAGIFWDPLEPPPGHSFVNENQHDPRPPQGLSPPQSALPPLSVSLTAQLIHDTGKVFMTQHFWNNTNSTIVGGACTFPLPAGCTVVSFSCRIGRNRIVRGQVRPRGEARAAFGGAANRNRTATLPEQVTPEIFTTSLGNIPANTELKAKMEFIVLLKHHFSSNFDCTTLTSLLAMVIHHPSTKVLLGRAFPEV